MVMSSTIYRTQYQNLNDVIERLEGLLVEASQIPQGPSELTLARIKELYNCYNSTGNNNFPYKQET
jgi:hypothetical protein